MEVLGQVQPYMDEVLAHTSDENEAIDGFLFFALFELHYTYILYLFSKVQMYRN